MCEFCGCGPQCMVCRRGMTDAAREAEAVRAAVHSSVGRAIQEAAQQAAAKVRRGAVLVGLVPADARYD